MCQSEKLLENLPSSMFILPEHLKIEPAELPTSINTDIKIEPDLTIEAIPIVNSPSGKDAVTNQPTSHGSSTEEFLSCHQDNKHLEPLIRVRPTNTLKYCPEELPSTNPMLQNPKIVDQEMTNIMDKSKGERWDIPSEPADLSNKKPENVTCMPEIDYIKDETDNMSVYSNSSDPERLEVDMSQVSFNIINSYYELSGYIE